MNPDNRIFIFALLVAGLGVGIIQVFLVPPFQEPDEIQHFLYSAAYAYDKPTMETVETRVLQLLKDYKWFHFVGIGPGWENTKSVSDISFVFHFSLDKKSTRRTIFHIIYGKILKISGIRDVLAAFYFMRILSTFLYMAVLVLAFIFFKAYFPGQWEYLSVGLLVVFQLAAILNSVNYDVFMILLGSLFFVLAYRYMRYEKKIDLAFLMVLAGTAALTKLVGFMFLVYLFILPVMTLKSKAKGGFKRFKYVGLGLLFFLMGFCWLNYMFPERFFNLYSQIFRVLEDMNASLTVGGDKALRLGFFDSIADSFYFYGGWMGFKLSGAWYVIIKIFLVLSIVGLVLAVISKKLNTASLEKRWIIYMLFALILQVFTIWLYYGRHPISQGRYVYPLIIPVIMLVYTGLHAIESRFCFKRDYLQISFILFQVVMWVFAVARIISVFYLEIASPHPGL